MQIVLHVKYLLLFKILMELEITRQIFGKSSNIKFHENPSSGRRVVACGRTDGHRDRQADRHDEANSRFHNFAKATKSQISFLCGQLIQINLKSGEVVRRVTRKVTSHFTISSNVNTLRTGDADLSFYITTVQDG